MKRNGLRLHGKASTVPGSKLSSALCHCSITSRCRQIMTLITFLSSHWECLSQQSSTLNLRTLQQNCVPPAHTLIVRAGSTCRSSPPAKPSLGAWALVRNVHFCSNYLLLLQHLHTPIWAGFWTSVRVSLFQEAIQAQVLINHPVCYWCWSWRTGFQPLSDPATLYAKNLTFNGICEFFFSRTTSILRRAAGILLLHFFWVKCGFLIAISTKDTC